MTIDTTPQHPTVIASVSAVIITLDTPYYGLADEHGDIRIPDVPPGNYSMQVWSEAISPDAMKTLARHVTVTENANTDVGKVTIQIAPGTLSARGAFTGGT